MPTYRGAWRLRVIGSEAMCPQRVLIDGAAEHVIPGQVDQAQVITGKQWRLRAEYHDGSGWRRSAQLTQETEHGADGSAVHVILIKHKFAIDHVVDDLVLRLERVVGPPVTVAGATGPGSVVTRAGHKMLAVTVTNTGEQDVGGELTLEISAAGRRVLAEHGVEVRDEWSDAVLRETRQVIIEGAVAVPPLGVGNSVTMCFPVACHEVRGGSPEVEFELWSGLTGQVRRQSAVVRLVGETPGPAGHSDGVQLVGDAWTFRMLPTLEEPAG